VTRRRADLARDLPAFLSLQQWVVITINLLVHFIMYYYYFATAGGKKLWVRA
jgi:hypothetical protein